MTFKIGDKIERISSGYKWTHGPEKGRIYTFFRYVNGTSQLEVDELSGTWDTDKFEKFDPYVVKKESSGQAISLAIKNLIDSKTVQALGGKVTFTTDNYEVTIQYKGIEDLK